MAKGKTTVRFIGGVLAGHVEEDFNTKDLVETIEAPTGTWIRQANDGAAQIMQDGDLDSFWDCYKVDIYDKQVRTDESGAFIYKHAGSTTVNRCSAKTKQGKRCANRAIQNQDCCSRHTSKK